MNDSVLLSPADLHNRAIEAEELLPPLNTLPLYQTVIGFINSSPGHSRVMAPFCNLYTNEYVIIPLPGSMLDNEVPRIVAALREAGYFVSVKDDSLARFHEEALMIVCWDPRVIAASSAGYTPDANSFRTGMCVLPGKSDVSCSHCFDCVEFFNRQAESAD